MSEQQKSASASASTKRKPGRPARVTTDSKTEPELKTEDATLHARITNLENCLAKMAHFSGSERVLDEFDIERWTVTKESMQKFKG